ncbi:hypothetical protein DUNSADRAFT_15179 [Dunaliella salina]|uniref:Uncharacterized protein n=1 Tax=Dunaliella salina TaxID=3046 RepID=A0ABQ7G5X2_DUNSA|nr:hypothetical protein DUNSADRAFT_15179 [Dunaliella salina]|eukprot:KAF5830005.1 hypothetical protein DUNSADRAFT_15179 [Dunaliella salina]
MYASATTPSPERPQPPACHIRAPTPPPPLPVSASLGSGSPALNPLSPLASSSLATPASSSVPSAAPPVYNPSTGHVLYTGQSGRGGPSGRRGGLSQGRGDNGTRPAALPGGGVRGLWGGVGSLGHPSPAAAAAAAAAAAQLPGAAGGPSASVFGDVPVRELPGQGLPEFAGALQGLQLISGCPPPPEPAPEPEEGEVRWEVDAGGRPPPKDPWDSPEAQQEVDMLDAMLNQAPGLQDLEIIGAGQMHVRLLARYRQQVPTHNLRLVCHKHVDVRDLLRANPVPVVLSSRCPLASTAASTPCPVNLHLTLKGLTLGELDDLVAAATGTDAGAAVASCQVRCPSCRAKLARGGEGQGQAGSDPKNGISGHHDKVGDKQEFRPRSGRRRGGAADVDGQCPPCTSSSHKGKRGLNRGRAAERGGVHAVNAEKQGDAAGAKRSLSAYTTARHNVVRTSSAASSSAARRAASPASPPSSYETQDDACTCSCSGSARCSEGPSERRTSVHLPACRLQTLCIEQSKEVSTREVAAALARMHSVCHISLTACRQITDDIVLEVARLRRPIRLCVSNCRLVMPQRWGAAVAAARHVPGCWLIDVKYAEGLGGKNEVEFA